VSTKTRQAEFRYIDIDWGDDQHNHPVWRLRVDGKLVATAPVGDWRHPPFALTEGRKFTPQYHSATSGMSGEPDSWIHRSAEPRRSPFWPLMVAVAAAVIAAAAFKPALIVAGVLVVVAVAVEVRRQ
jgi:hypothetical protein